MNLVNLNIRHAIKHRLIMELEYDQFFCVVEPFMYGVSDTGRLVLLAFYAKKTTDKTEKWAVFDLDRVKNIKIHCERFDVEARKNYLEMAAQMKIIYAKVWK